MGFKTIDLDAPGGYDRYNKMKKTNSVKKAFEDEIEQKNEEALAPVVEEAKKQDTNFMSQYEGKWETGGLPPKAEQYNTPTQDNIVRTGVVSGVSQLRVRTKPEGDVMYLISENSIVKILEDHESWWKVETAPGRVGFVMKAYIKEQTEGG